MAATPFTSLPPEVILSIAKQCDAADIVSLTRCCRYTQAVCDDTGVFMHTFFDRVGEPVDERNELRLREEIAGRGPERAKLTWGYLAKAALMLPGVGKQLASVADPSTHPYPTPVKTAVDIVATFTAMGYISVLDRDTTKNMARAACRLFEDPGPDEATQEHRQRTRRMLSARVFLCLAAGMLHPAAGPELWELDLPAAPPLLPIGPDEGFPPEATHLLCIALTLHALSSRAARVDCQTGDLGLRPRWAPSVDRLGLADDAPPPLPRTSSLPDAGYPAPASRAFARGWTTWRKWYEARIAALFADLRRGAWRGVVAYYHAPGAPPACSVLEDMRFGPGAVEFAFPDGRRERFRAEEDEAAAEVRVLSAGGGNVFRVFMTPLGLAGGAGPGLAEEAREFIWLFREEWCEGGRWDDGGDA